MFCSRGASVKGNMNFIFISFDLGMPTGKHHGGDNTNQDGTCLLETGSGPIRKDLFRLRDLFR